MTTKSTARPVPPIPAPKYTIGQRVTGRTAEIIGKHAAKLPHDMHMSYNHHDGMIGWCDSCGLDESGRPPISLADAYLLAEKPGRHAERETPTAIIPVQRPVTAELPAHRRADSIINRKGLV